ncbi:MAG: hypothetical protein M1831_006332 [Alyxoria varia]|nr:MAG: hypothetical protein M1831_006332 [Alyxoria varia]
MDDELSALTSKPEPTFQGVPLEIREKIYQYWLLSSCGGDYHNKSGEREPQAEWLIWPQFAKHRRHVKHRGRSPLDLLLASRQVYEEANRVFWQFFRFGFAFAAEALDFLDEIPTIRLDQIHHIHLRLIPQVPTRWVRGTPNEESMLWHLIPDFEQLRSKLPHLRSVTFCLDGSRRVGVDLPVSFGIQNFQFQMAPFWHLKTIYVTYLEAGFEAPHSVLVKNIEEGEHDDDANEMKRRVSSWISNTEIAIWHAYWKYMNTTELPDLNVNKSPTFEERFPRAKRSLFYDPDDNSEPVETGLEANERWVTNDGEE